MSALSSPVANSLPAGPLAMIEALTAGVAASGTSTPAAAVQPGFGSFVATALTTPNAASVTDAASGVRSQPTWPPGTAIARPAFPATTLTPSMPSAPTTSPDAAGAADAAVGAQPQPTWPLGIAGSTVPKQSLVADTSEAMSAAVTASSDTVAVADPGHFAAALAPAANAVTGQADAVARLVSTVRRAHLVASAMVGQVTGPTGPAPAAQVLAGQAATPAPATPPLSPPAMNDVPPIPGDAAPSLPPPMPPHANVVVADDVATTATEPATTGLLPTQVKAKPPAPHGAAPTVDASTTAPVASNPALLFAMAAAQSASQPSAVPLPSGAPATVAAQAISPTLPPTNDASAEPIRVPAPRSAVADRTMATDAIVAQAAPEIGALAPAPTGGGGKVALAQSAAASLGRTTRATASRTGGTNAGESTTRPEYAAHATLPTTPTSTGSAKSPATVATIAIMPSPLPLAQNDVLASPVAAAPAIPASAAPAVAVSPPGSPSAHASPAALPPSGPAVDVASEPTGTDPLNDGAVAGDLTTAGADPVSAPHQMAAVTMADASVLAAADMAPHRADPAAAAPTLAAALPATSAPRADAQVANAVLRLASAGGGQQVTISLAPRELGQVAIRIDRHATGATSVAVSVERPATLDLLRHDKPQLQLALERAGLTVSADTITLHLRVASDAAGTVSASPVVSPLPDRGVAALPGHGVQTGLGGQTQHGQPQGQGQGQRRDAGPWLEAGHSASVITPVAWQRDGLDITA